MNSYLGETNEKRVVRSYLYKVIAARLEKQGIIKPTCLGISGPTAGEVGCFRHIVGAEDSDIVLYEKETSYAEDVKKKYPGITVINDLLGSYYLPTSHMADLSVLSLDLSSNTLSSQVTDLVRCTSACLAVGGQMLFTFFRGRESKKNADTFREATNIDGPINDYMRMCGYLNKFPRDLEPTGLFFYDSKHPDKPSRHSPMGVLMFHKKAGFKWNSTLGNSLLALPIYGESSFSLKSESVPALLAEDIKYLQFNHMLSATEISEVLNLPVRKVAAHVANNTRRSHALHFAPPSRFEHASP